jgi:hypothetical protein
LAINRGPIAVRRETFALRGHEFGIVAPKLLRERGGFVPHREFARL